VVSDSYILIPVGIALILVGTLLIFLDLIRRTSTKAGGAGEKRVEAGGAVVVGPIPIVFGSSKEVTKAMLVMAIILTLLAIILTLITTQVVVR
jgi:uncharacterized protein (TIGR00304 family)